MNPSINEMDIVNLLSMIDPRGNRDQAIRVLEGILPEVDLTNGSIAFKLYQILPAFFAHYYLKNEKEIIIRLVDKVTAVENDESRLFLLRKWRNFVCPGGAVVMNVVAPCQRLASLLGYEDLEFFIHICRYVKNERKLHKYIYFFANITYLQFLEIQESTITELAEEIGLLPITNGARGAIVSMMSQLKGRVQLLRRYAKGDYFSAGDFENKIDICYRDLMKIIGTPIRRSDLTICAQEEEISFLLVASLRHVSVATKVFGDPAWKIKVDMLLKRAASMRYVFNRSQSTELIHLVDYFNKPEIATEELTCTINSCDQPASTSNNRCEPIVNGTIVTSIDEVVRSIREKALKIPRMFVNDEFQAGYERTIIFLEFLLMDD